MKSESSITHEEVLALFAEGERQLEATKREISKLAKQVGEITDTLGRFSEEQVRPGALRLFKKEGLLLDEIYHRVVVKKEGRFLLEIDLLLANKTHSVAVEVKTRLRQKDVDEQVERLGLLQANPNRIVEGTTLLGAVAGMIVTDAVAEYAEKAGLYVLRPKGNTVEITNQDHFKPREWVVKH